MYEAFYGFERKPFALLPDPEFLYPSKRHRTALSLLQYGLSGQSGFIVISGEVGSGKTTLIHELLKNADPATAIGLITNTHISKEDLIRWVLLAFSIDAESTDRVDAYKRFSDFLTAREESGHHAVLIIDEAQNLDIETLEELRMLSNLNAGKDPLLQIILVGQPELFEKLNRPELKQFLQRVSANFHLEPLNFQETLAYIRHRLKVAGGDPELFDVLAASAVYFFSQGVPRLINVIADMALVYGYAEEKRTIDVETILDVADDRKAGKLETDVVDFDPGDRDGTVKKIIEIAAAVARDHAKEQRTEKMAQIAALEAVTDHLARDSEPVETPASEAADPPRQAAPEDPQPAPATKVSRDESATPAIIDATNDNEPRTEKRRGLPRFALVASVLVAISILLSATIEFVAPGTILSQLPVIEEDADPQAGEPSAPDDKSSRKRSVQ